MHCKEKFYSHCSILFLEMWVYSPVPCFQFISSKFQTCISDFRRLLIAWQHRNSWSLLIAAVQSKSLLVKTRGHLFYRGFGCTVFAICISNWSFITFHRYYFSCPRATSKPQFLKHSEKNSNWKYTVQKEFRNCRIYASKHKFFKNLQFRT